MEMLVEEMQLADNSLKSIISLYNETENNLKDLSISVCRNGNDGNKTDNRALADGYMLVDSMDYIPMNQKLYDRLYVNDTGEVDKKGNPIYGLANLHNSAIAPDDFNPVAIGWKYLPLASFADLASLTSGELLIHFFNGNGEDYYYDASSLLLNKKVRENFSANVQEIASASEKYLRDGEKIIISNSQDNALPGCQSFLDRDGDIEQFLHIVGNANTFATVNSADAGIVCEVTRDGNHYCMNYKYYIIDYDKNVLPELYDLNRYGYANNFVGYGKISGEVEWDAGESIYK